MTTHKQNLLAAVLVGALRLITDAAARAADKKPNVVFILTDTLGYSEVGCYSVCILQVGCVRASSRDAPS